MTGDDDGGDEPDDAFDDSGERHPRKRVQSSDEWFLLFCTQG